MTLKYSAVHVYTEDKQLKKVEVKGTIVVNPEMVFRHGVFCHESARGVVWEFCKRQGQTLVQKSIAIEIMKADYK